MVNSRTARQLYKEQIQRDFERSKARETALEKQIAAMQQAVEGNTKSSNRFKMKGDGALTFEEAGWKPSGREDTAHKLSRRLAKMEIESVGGWDGVSPKTGQYRKDAERLEGSLDEEIRNSGFKEQLVTCGHPECNKQVRASDGYCSRLHESETLAKARTREINTPDAPQDLPSFDDVRYGLAPQSKQQILLGKDKARAKSRVLSGEL